MDNVSLFEKGKVWQKLLCVCFVLLAVFGIALMLPVVHGVLFEFGDYLAHKSINRESWEGTLFHLGTSCCFFGGLFAIISFLQKWKAIFISIFEKSGVVSHLKENKKLYFKYFIFFICCFIFAYLSLIRANVLYGDDLARVTGAGNDFSYNRYVASYLFSLYCLTTRITDIAPLSQIIACIFLSASAIILIMCFAPSTKFSFWNVIALLPLGISPYFAMCMSYRFDAPGMAASIFFALLPIVFYRNRLAFFSVSFVSLLCMLMTYQASSGIFPITIVFLVLKAFLDGKSWKEIWTFIWTSIVAFIIPMIVFRVVIMSFGSRYVDSTIFAVKDLPGGVIENLKAFYSLILETFPIFWKLIVLCLLVLFIILSTIHSKQNKFLSAVFSVLGLLFSLSLAFGIYPLITKPLITARSLYGFTVFIALVMISAVILKKSLPVKILSLILVWGFTAFSFTYGNALAENERYERFRLDKVVYDLEELNLIEKQGRKTIVLNIDGESIVSPVVRNMASYNKLLYLNVGSTGSGYKNRKRLSLHYDIDAELHFHMGKYYDDYMDLCKRATSTMPLVKSTYYHDIYADDEYVYILLKQHPESDWRKR